MDCANNLIFISIAAYRDPQLVPTIDDCIAKSRFPDHLRFGICWQRSPDEEPLPYQGDDHFQILDIDWRDSKGACWARAEIMKLWRGEAWFLQVDSHCRFASGWDEKLIRAMQQAASAKPILSTYASPFTPGGNEILEDGPLQIAFQGFTQDGIPHMKPMAIPNWRNLNRPWRARFLSAGFLFAPGGFVNEVGYDPELYFLGEEAAMSLRAFTNGYDLFHPNESIVWHDYVRSDSKKHWGDHTKANNIRREWSELDSHSKNKVKKLLTGQPLDTYGLGSVRTLQQYEEYAGLSFSRCKAQDYTVRCEEPPNPEPSPDWADKIYPWLVRIVVRRSSLPPEFLDDPSFLYIGVHDSNQSELYRRDFPQSELEPLFGNAPNLVLVCEFQSGNIPATWTIWPVSRSRGWLTKLEGPLPEEDFTIVVEDEPEVPDLLQPLSGTPSRSRLP